MPNVAYKTEDILRIIIADNPAVVRKALQIKSDYDNQGMIPIPPRAIITYDEKHGEVIAFWD
jgi:hypothetical protein